MRRFLLPVARLVREFSRGVHTGHAIRHSRRPHPDTSAALDRPSGDRWRQPSGEPPTSVAAHCSEHRLPPLPDHTTGPPSVPTAEPPPATATSPPATSPPATTERAPAGAAPSAETADLAVEGARPEPGTGSAEPAG